MYFEKDIKYFQNEINLLYKVFFYVIMYITNQRLQVYYEYSKMIRKSISTIISTYITNGSDANENHIIPNTENALWMKKSF